MSDRNKRAVFMDRDGTIARDVPYCSRPEDFQIFNGVPEAIRSLNDAGLKAVVITNQSGVGRGYFTEEMLGRIHRKMLTDLERQGARIDGIYYCPHHPDDNCDCRKPRTALFHRAAHDLDLDFATSFMIGDMAQDIEAGKAVGCRTVLVLQKKDGASASGGPPLKPMPDYTAVDFAAAVTWILAQE